MPKRIRRKFTDEQRADAVRLVKDSTQAQVARNLGIAGTTLSRWVIQAEIDEGEGAAGALTTAEREELRKLRRENRTLKTAALRLS